MSYTHLKSLNNCNLLVSEVEAKYLKNLRISAQKWSTLIWVHIQYLISTMHYYLKPHITTKHEAGGGTIGVNSIWKMRVSKRYTYIWWQKIFNASHEKLSSNAEVYFLHSLLFINIINLHLLHTWLVRNMHVYNWHVTSYKLSVWVTLHGKWTKEKKNILVVEWE